MKKQKPGPLVDELNELRQRIFVGNASFTSPFKIKANIATLADYEYLDRHANENFLQIEF